MTQNARRLSELDVIPAPAGLEGQERRDYFAMVEEMRRKASLLRERMDPAELARRQAMTSIGHRVWQAKARPSQLPPADWLRTWYVRGGRGSGKTLTGSNTLAGMILDDWDDPGEWAIVFPTFGDARDVGMESMSSGLIRALGGTVRAGKLIEPGLYLDQYNRSTGTLFLANGGVVYTDGADDGADRVQGRNLKGCWADEVGLWKKWQTAWYESIAFAVRLHPGKIIATGTPKAERSARKLVKDLLADPMVVKTVLKTRENLENLDAGTVAELLKLEGTRRGRQELDGELLEDVEGALWTLARIEELRLDIAAAGRGEYITETLLPTLREVVVGVDPTGSNGAGSDECGIVVAGLGVDGHGYVMADTSEILSPHEWGLRVVDLFRLYKADRVLAEANYGGQMVADTIHNIAPYIPVRLVHASRGKWLRAEPVSVLYERELVHHVGIFPELEDQMCTYKKDDGWSPDRLDALVWCFTPGDPSDPAEGLRVVGVRTRARVEVPEATMIPLRPSQTMTGSGVAGAIPIRPSGNR